MRISYKDYDQMIESWNDYKNPNPEWLPTIHEIQKYIEPNLNKWMYFIIWLLETTKQTKDNIESWRYLNTLLNKNINFEE